MMGEAMRHGHWCLGGADAKFHAFDWNRCYFYQEDRVFEFFDAIEEVVSPSCLVFFSCRFLFDDTYTLDKPTKTRCFILKTFKHEIKIDKV